MGGLAHTHGVLVPLPEHLMPDPQSLLSRRRQSSGHTSRWIIFFHRSIWVPSKSSKNKSHSWKSECSSKFIQSSFSACYFRGQLYTRSNPERSQQLLKVFWRQQVWGRERYDESEENKWEPPQRCQCWEISLPDWRRRSPLRVSGWPCPDGRYPTVGDAVDL